MIRDKPVREFDLEPCGEKNKYLNYRRLYLYVYINFIIRLFFFYHVHVICDAILTSWINEGPLFLKVLDGSKDGVIHIREILFDIRN